jgi:23S rRNA pseudouridine1911/1915/1917 synthase
MEAGQRLDVFLSQLHQKFSRSYLKTLIEKNFITVNNQSVKSGYSLKVNDTISMNLPEPEPSPIIAEAISLDIIYEDGDIMVINKPAGLIVHPGAGNKCGTLVNALLYYCKDLSGINGMLRPGIVHRLDKNTSGLLVVAKHDKSHLELSRQFETKSIRRTYDAIVWGVPGENEGKIVSQIGRSLRDRKKMTVLKESGREAITNFKVIENYTYLSSLEVTLQTGRTHQIRVHLNFINHPVFGDPDYNGRKSQINRLPPYLQKRGMLLLKQINRQALHARQLELIHPITGEKMRFESPLPEDMMNLHNKIPKVLMLE